MRNREITSPEPLLNESGDIATPGWARRPQWIYDRDSIKAPWYRIKEWDYYMVVGQGFAIAFTMSDVGYLGVQSVNLFTFGDKPWVHTSMSVNPLPRGAMALKPDSASEGVNSYRSPRFALEYEKEGERRHVRCAISRFHKGRSLISDIVLHEQPMDSIVMATPWPEPAHFYYNQKINCMRADGFIELGDKVFFFDPATDFATLDWGRGVWTYDNTWYWSSGNAEVDGHAFGFNLGYGFADTTAASENVVFYDGVAHKLDDVSFIMTDPKNYEAPWKFTSSDSRFEADFVPIIDRKGKIDIGFVCTDQHQVFGRLSGTVILDDGTILPLKEVVCFVEKVRMKY